MASRSSTDGARARMQQAAIDLFAASGYQATTVDQIAARAGVTQRTFFRHFVDKGEVLFDDDDELLGVLVGTVAAAPMDEPLLATTHRALGALADVLQPLREKLRLRAAVIGAEPDLRERELLKLDRWHEAITAALIARGVSPGQATLATALGNACWTAAYQPWVTDRARRSLRRRIDAAFVDLTRLAAPGDSAPTDSAPTATVDDIDADPPTAEQLERLHECYTHYRDVLPEGMRVELYGNRVRIEPGAFGARGDIINSLAAALAGQLPDDADLRVGPAAGTPDRAREQMARARAVPVPAGFVRIIHDVSGFEDLGDIGEVHVVLRERWSTDRPC